MKIGYACIAIDVPETNLKNCRLKNASELNLLNLISHNLTSLENIIEYNIANNIKLFRISSDIIPFGSSYINKLPWWNIFELKLNNLGNRIKENNIRISMHPGQYTVLNSPNDDVLKRAVEDLIYHTKVLDSLNAGCENKIILHIGGVYNAKNEAINRFIQNYNKLEDIIKQRLVIENDDKFYNINDVLEISSILNIPVVFDNLHNKLNPYNSESKFVWINTCKETWKKKDGCQKIHYSQQNLLKRTGAHSETININEFMDFYNCLSNKNIDIMLEVKDKNFSAIKCIKYITNQINKE